MSNPYLGGINNTGGIQQDGGTLTPGARRILMSLAVIVILGAIVVGVLFATGVVKLEKENVARSCEETKDCKAGQKCGDVGGKKECVATCEANSNCNAGLQCYNGVCSEIKNECNADADCPEAQTCGTVTPDDGQPYGKCVAVTCTSSTGCDAGFECVNDKCELVPNQTCLGGRQCPPEAPLCDSFGVCLPGPSAECASDECTAKGPDFFCNEFDRCVKLPAPPSVVPVPARASSTGLSTAQIVFVVLGSFAALFCAVEFYRIGRRTYKTRGRSFSPRQRERNSGELIAALLCFLAVILAFLFIGFDANDSFLIIPGVLLVAAAGLLVYFKIEENRTNYTKQEVEEKGLDLQQQSYQDLQQDLNILDALTADPEISDVVKLEFMKQVGKNLAYSQFLSTQVGDFVDNFERLKLNRDIIVQSRKLQDDLEDSDPRLAKLRERASGQAQAGYRDGQNEYLEDLNYRTKDTKEARAKIEQVEEFQQEILLWQDNIEAIRARNEAARLIVELNERPNDPALEQQYNEANLKLQTSLEKQRQERGEMLDKLDRKIKSINQDELKEPTLSSSAEMKRVLKGRSKDLNTFSVGPRRTLERSIRDTTKSLSQGDLTKKENAFLMGKLRRDKDALVDLKRKEKDEKAEVKKEQRERKKIRKTRRIKDKKKLKKKLEKQQRKAQEKLRPLIKEREKKEEEKKEESRKNKPRAESFGF